jgi:hypothetical protein
MLATAYFTLGRETMTYLEMSFYGVLGAAKVRVAAGNGIHEMKTAAQWRLSVVFWGPTFLQGAKVPPLAAGILSGFAVVLQIVQRGRHPAPRLL